MIVCWWLQEPSDGARHLEEEKELRPTQTSLATAVVEPAVRVNRQNQRKSTRKGTVFAVLDHDAGNVADLCRFYNFKRWYLLQSARHDMKEKWPEERCIYEVGQRTVFFLLWCDAPVMLVGWGSCRLLRVGSTGEIDGTRRSQACHLHPNTPRSRNTTFAPCLPV